MEKNIKEYFNMDYYGRFNQDKHNLDSELVDVVVHSCNETEEISQYRKMGQGAFNKKSYKEAMTYYRKILSDRANDSDACFYHSVCNVLNGDPNRKSIDDVYKNYISACENMPIEIDWREKNLE